MATNVASFKLAPTQLNLIFGHSRSRALPQGALTVLHTLVGLLGHLGQFFLHLLLGSQSRLFTLLNTEGNLSHLSVGVLTASSSTLMQTPFNPPQAATVNLYG